MTEPDLQRWSREVAEDPGAPAFVPLARAYRRTGRREAALKLVLRGLERNPEHVAGHLLLALLHVDAGDREHAGDEWQMALRFEPGNFDAHRGLGFLALERGDLAAARRHLESADRARPGDPAVAQAREVLRRREAGSQAQVDARAGARAAEAGAADPASLFESLAEGGAFLGALLLDAHGLVLAGTLRQSGPADQGRGETLGALLNPVVDEAGRASEMLGLGPWGGLLVDCEQAVLHLSPVAEDAVVLLAARPDAPAGWVVRAAERAAGLARRWTEKGR